MARTSLASTYQEERLSRDPGPPFSDESPVGWALLGAASTRAQPRGSLATAASGPDSEVGRLVPPTGSLVAAVDGVHISGGQGCLSDPDPQGLPKSNTTHPAKPPPREAFPGGRLWVPTGQARAFMSTVCPQWGRAGVAGLRGDGTCHPRPQSPQGVQGSLLKSGESHPRASCLPPPPPQSPSEPQGICQRAHWPDSSAGLGAGWTTVTPAGEPSCSRDMRKHHGGELALISGQQGRGAGSPVKSRRASRRKGGAGLQGWHSAGVAGSKW